MNYKHVTTLIIALALGALALSCADSESRMPLGSSTAIIKLGHPDLSRKSIKPGEPLAASEVLPPPATFNRILVSVSGPDIGTIQKNFPYSDTISIDVPAGTLRRFEVTAFVAPYYADDLGTWSAASTFKGIATANVPSGATVSVPVLMIMDESRFVIPDYMNGRIVWFDSVPTAVPSWQYAFVTNPQQIDFDARGRIYVLAKSAVGGYDMIYRSDIITSTQTQVLNESYFYQLNVRAFTIDRRRNILYLAQYNYGIDIISVDLGQTLPAMSSVFLNTQDLETYTPYFSDITALDVGNDGVLTIIGNDYYANQIMMRYNPFASKTVCMEGCTTVYGFPVGEAYDFNTLGISLTLQDVRVREQDVCVLTNPNDNNGFVLMQFQATPAGFILGPHFGDLSYSPMPGIGLFFGPQKFATRRDDTLVIIDEGWDGSSADRLVLTDFDVSKPWATFGSTGSGTGTFQFFNYYSAC
jgi:hypothetical protein